jgi:uncharacterized protein YdeI (YjbR/CyaY-like superfamily)
MGTRDKRIDAYIAKSPDFAKPILTQIRAVVHEACPDVEETLKWSHPAFMYNGLLCGMHAFKAHCALGFWKGTLVTGTASDDGAGQFGRLTKVSDLPSKKVLAGYVKKAMALNDEGTSAPKRVPKPKKELVVPDYFTAAALKKNKKALATFEAFAPSHRREYVEWITEAKSEETRARRLEQAVEWMAAGKSRNWKYA